MNKTKAALVSKRQKIVKAESTVFIAVAVGAVVVMFSLMSIRFLWERKSYNDRVIKAKTVARDGIETNLTNLDKLSDQYAVLNSSATTNATSILHALPPVYDFASLSTAMQSLAQQSGVTLTGQVGQDESGTAQASAETSQPVEIPLTLEVSGSYDAVVKYMQNLELSTRQINVTSSSLTSSGGGTVKASITASTYYQPARSLDVSKSEVK